MVSRFSNLPIKQKLVVVITSAALFGVLLIGVVFVVFEYHTYQNLMEKELSTLVNMTAKRSNAGLLFRDIELLEENANGLSAHEDIDLVCVYDQWHTLVAQSSAISKAECPKERVLPANGFDESNFHWLEEISVDNTLAGALYIRANKNRLSALFRNYLLMALGAGLVVSLTTFLVSIRLQRLVLDPLLRLTATAVNVTHQKDYSLRAEKVGEDEIGQVIDAFNSMLAAVEQRDLALSKSKEGLEQTVEERTAKLQMANQELEAFSYSVSHDLRAPLRAIGGYSVALLEDCDDELEALGRDYINRIMNASARMGVLIDSLLHLSRVSRQSMSQENVDLALLAKNCIEDLRAADRERNIIVNIPQHLWVKGDPRLLSIVVDNLVCNAWKYTTKTPKAMIELGQQDGAYFVKDNGAGFDMRYADKLFSAFQRLHHENQFEGTGIGLATVARIISRHGGSIWAEGEVGQGAAFYFTLTNQKEDVSSAYEQAVDDEKTEHINS